MTSPTEGQTKAAPAASDTVKPTPLRSTVEEAAARLSALRKGAGDAAKTPERTPGEQAKAQPKPVPAKSVAEDEEVEEDELTEVAESTEDDEDDAFNKLQDEDDAKAEGATAASRSQTKAGDGKGDAKTPTLAERVRIILEKEADLEARERRIADILEAKLVDLEQSDAFSDIKTSADLDRLFKENPMRFMEWQLHMTKLGQVKAEHERTKAQEFERFNQKRLRDLVRIEPKLASPEKAKRFKVAVRRFADHMKITMDELSGLDGRGLATMWYAAQWFDRAERRKQTGKEDLTQAREVRGSASDTEKASAGKARSKVLAPGTASQNQPAETRRMRTARKALRDNGTVEAAADLLRLRREAAQKRKRA